MRKVLFEGLIRGPLSVPPPAPGSEALRELAESVNRAARVRLGRSLSIRQVDAGSCNGCELEIHAINNAFYDLERFGFHFVASPRHADVLMVTGPVTKNMREALKRTYNATPDPTAECSPAATRSKAASKTWCRSTCTFPAARRTRKRSWPGCWRCCRRRLKPPLW
jgi:hypothetical protein